MSKVNYRTRAKTHLRAAVQQFTNAELRQRVRHEHGLALLTDREARAWKTMSYGVLLERQRSKTDRVSPYRENAE